MTSRMNSGRGRSVILIAVVLLVVLAAFGWWHWSGRGLTAGGTGDGAAWATYNGDSKEHRFAALDQIDAGNVGRLGLAWFADFDTSRGQESTPLVVDGVMYVTTAWSKVNAYAADTGKPLWQFDPQVPGAAAVSACCDVVNRGAAYADGRVFVGTIDGRLIAIDARTGKQIWATATTDPGKPYTITGAPRVARGKVFIGNGGAEYGVRGYVSAYDQVTGKLAWRFFTVPGEPGVKDGAASDEILERLARGSWSGDRYWRIGGGGTVWDAIVYDEELNQLYIGTGNGGPWDHVIRSEGKGDNLFLGSILALDPDTGRYIWHYQENPGETWDFTSTSQIVLADLPVGGAERQVLMHAPKNGFFYVIDRKTGKPLSAEKFVPMDWAERIDLKTGRPIENPSARYLDAPFLANSGSSGAHNWHPMSFDPTRRLVFIPAQQVPILYKRDANFRFDEGLWTLGIDLMAGGFPENAQQIEQAKQAQKGWLLAWDPVRQREVWRVPHNSAWNGGVLATAGGLVFQGLTDRTFRAWRSDDGKQVWSFDAQSRVLAGAMSYSIGGRQFIAVTVGAGSTLALPAFDGPRAQPVGRVLVFALDGKAVLPANDATPAPLNTSVGGAFPAGQVAAGKATYDRICAACHGAGTLSEGVVPDLKRSGALGDAALWRQIVIDGILQDNGMVSFAKHISPQDAEAVRAYVASEVRRKQQER